MAARDTRSLSGTSVLVRQLAAGAAQAGHEVRLLSSRRSPAPPGVRRARVPMAPFTSLTRAWSFDILARWSSKRLGSDILHGHGDLTRQDVLTVNNVDAAEARSTGREKVGSRGTLFVRARQFEPGAARRIVTVSKRARQDLEEFYGVKPSRSEVIYLGVDSERFRPEGGAEDRIRLREELVLPEGARIFLSLISGDAERRNISGLVAAFAAARLGRWDVLLIVGAPEALGYPAAEGLLKEDRLRLMPKTSRPEEIYRACDAFVLPAHYETFGLTALEAMASGLPCVVTESCGVSELLRDGRDALVVQDSRDISALSAALERLAHEPGLAGRLAAEGLSTAKARPWKKTVSEYLALYEAVHREKTRG